MKRFFFVLALILSLLSIPALGQVEADINRPSVNADQFGLAVKAETALNKGQLSVNIPLLTLKGKGYDLPISLSFYSHHWCHGAIHWQGPGPSCRHCHLICSRCRSRIAPYALSAAPVSPEVELDPPTWSPVWGEIPLFTP